MDDIEPLWVWRISQVFAMLRNFRDRLPPLLVGKTRDEMRQILWDDLQEVLTAFSQGDTYTPQTATVKKMVKQGSEGAYLVKKYRSAIEQSRTGQSGRGVTTKTYRIYQKRNKNTKKVGNVIYGLFPLINIMLFL